MNKFSNKYQAFSSKKLTQENLNADQLNNDYGSFTNSTFGCKTKLKAYRKFTSGWFESEFVRKKPAKAAFYALLTVNANREGVYKVTGGEFLNKYRGFFASKRSFFRTLNWLQKENLITFITNTVGTTITITDFQEHQSKKRYVRVYCEDLRKLIRRGDFSTAQKAKSFFEDLKEFYKEEIEADVARKEAFEVRKQNKKESKKKSKSLSDDDSKPPKPPHIIYSIEDTKRESSKEATPKVKIVKIDSEKSIARIKKLLRLSDIMLPNGFLKAFKVIWLSNKLRDIINFIKFCRQERKRVESSIKDSKNSTLASILQVFRCDILLHSFGIWKGKFLKFEIFTKRMKLTEEERLKIMEKQANFLKNRKVSQADHERQVALTNLLEDKTKLIDRLGEGLYCTYIKNLKILGVHGNQIFVTADYKDPKLSDFEIYNAFNFVSWFDRFTKMIKNTISQNHCIISFIDKNLI